MNEHIIYLTGLAYRTRIAINGNKAFNLLQSIKEETSRLAAHWLLWSPANFHLSEKNKQLLIDRCPPKFTV